MRTGITGRVTTPEATELSGLALVGGTLWAHNDSGDTPRLFALTTGGALKRQVAITNAEAVDWEDIAARGSTLYVGDIGDNLAQRPTIAVYRLRAPSTPTAAATRIDLRYPDGPHDAEALLVDPRSGMLVIVIKSVDGVAGVYTGTSTLRRAATLELGVGQAITAGDVSADGRTIVLRSYDKAFVWTRRRGESLARALKRDPCTAAANLIGEGQGEAIALSRDGRAFYTVPEGPNPAIRRYSP